MSKHRLPEDDETSLLPATVEELAARERAHTRWSRQPLMITLATACLLVSGAAAWALSGSDAGPLTMVPPSSSASGPGDGFVDGFGTPSPAVQPTPTRHAPVHLTSPAPTGRPSVTPSALLTLTPRASISITATSPLSVVYQVDTWQSGYQLDLLVHNEGTTSLDWQIRIELPPNATIGNSWEARRSNEAGNVWIFTPPRGPLWAGGYHLFGFNGSRASGAFALVSCTIGSTPCVQA